MSLTQVRTTQPPRHRPPDGHPEGKESATTMGVISQGRLRRFVRRLTASRVLIIQLAVAAVTVVLAWTAGWQLAVMGLVVMHLVSATAALGPWGGTPAPPPPPAPPAPPPPPPPAPPAPQPPPVTAGQLARLEQRVDGLGARLVAGTERLRVEMLDALADTRSDSDTPRE